MVSRSQIDALSRRIEQLAEVFKPEVELPACPPIKVTFSQTFANTFEERQIYQAHIDRAAARKEWLRYEVIMEFKDRIDAGAPVELSSS